MTGCASKCARATPATPWTRPLRRPPRDRLRRAWPARTEVGADVAEVEQHGERVGPRCDVGHRLAGLDDKRALRASTRDVMAVSSRPDNYRRAGGRMRNRAPEVASATTRNRPRPSSQSPSRPRAIAAASALRAVFSARQRIADVLNRDKPLRRDRFHHAVGQLVALVDEIRRLSGPWIIATSRSGSA